MKKIAVFLVFAFVMFLGDSFGQFGGFSEQFGKNKVIWRNSANNFYQSENFDIWHSLDLRNENQRKFFETTVFDLEMAYQQLGIFFEYGLKERIPIIVYNSSWEFRNTKIFHEFVPVEASAFVESERRRMVIHESHSPPFKKRIIMHEMVHEFQNQSIRQNVPLGFIEGGAEFVAAKFTPDTRGDILSYQKADASNPELFLPTWRQFMNDSAHPYLQWVMLFKFLDEGYGVGDEFIKRGLKETKKSFGELIEEFTQGKIKNPDKYSENFDQLHRDFWSKKYASVFLQSPKPYEETGSLASKSITPREIPYPIFSASVSPDGKMVAGFSYAKNGLSLIVFDLDYPENGKEKKVTNLTPKFPPKPFEYPISQGGYFSQSGSDLSWFQDDTKSAIAFFAQDGRDHKLFIINSDDKDDIIKIDIPYDEAVSPKFGPNGKKIYFSASYNATRDIYEFDLETSGFKNLTSDLNFDTAPAVSPDGKILAYVAMDKDFQKLFLLNIETLEKRQLTFNRFNDDSPSFLADNKTIIYTSDERNGSWNIGTINIYTNETKHWSEFFGSVFTPQFSPIDPNKIYFTLSWQYDQFLDTIYQNLEVYEAILKEPFNSYIMEKKDENMIYSFQSFYAIGSQLDENQLKNPIKSPKKFVLSEGKISAGLSNYWGAFGYGAFRVSDIKENNIFDAGLVFSGSSFRLIDLAYLNRERRLSWGFGFYDHQLPLNYLHWDFQKGHPDQLVLNYTFGKETGGMAFAQYPLSKFSRVEAEFGLEKRDFEVWIDDKAPTDFPEIFTDVDKQFFSFFKNSGGFNVNFSGSYVRDTVLYSNIVQGPIHGNAFRAKFEVAPPLGFQKSKGYVSFSSDYRRYKRISDGSLLAFRFAGLRSSRATGDYVLLGGDNTLRAYPYGFIVGNQVLYGSAEIRFPLVDAVVFPGGFTIGSFRGFLFADYAYAKFSGSENFIGTVEKFRAQEGASLGPGISLRGFNFVWAWRKIDGFKNSVKDFYISKGWKL